MQFIRGLIKNERNEVNGLVEGVRLEAYSGDRRTVTYYVRPGGNNSNSGRTVAQAFETFERAIESIPLFAHEEQYIVDITDMGVISLAGGYTLPPFNSIDESATLNLTPPFSGFFFDSPIIVRAVPTTVDTITALEISSQSADAVTGQRTVVTTKSYTLNQHRDLFLVGSVLGQVAPIVSVTAGPNSAIETTATFNFTGPCTIVSLSAELNNSTASSTAAAIRMRGVSGTVQFQGIKFTGTHASSVGFDAQGLARQVRFSCCHLTGMQVTGGGQSQIVQLDNCVMTAKTNTIIGASCSFSNVSNRASRMDFRNSGPNQDATFIQSCVFDTLVSLPQSSLPNLDGSVVDISTTIVRNNTGDGIQINRAANWSMTSVAIRNCVGFGVDMDGGHAVLNTVRSTPGADNTAGGLRVRSGGQAEVNSATDVNEGGTAALTVGDNAAITWAAFNGGAPPRNEVDAVVQLARCYRFT